MRIDLFDPLSYFILAGCVAFILVVAGIFALAILPPVEQVVEPVKPWKGEDLK